jgi:hypothetical protein
MVSWITFAWQIEIVMILVLSFGLFIFIKAIKNLEKKFRIPIILILFSLVINIFLGIMIGIFVTKQIDYSSALWIIHPICGLGAAILLVWGGRKFFSEINNNL